MKHYTRLFPKLLALLTAAGKDGMTREQMSEKTGSTEATIRVCISQCRKNPELPRICTLNRNHQSALYVLAEHVPKSMSLKACADSPPNIMRMRIHEAGEKGIDSQDLRQGLSRSGAHRACNVLNKSGELYLLRLPGQVNGRRYFAKQEWRDAAKQELESAASIKRAQRQKERLAALAAKRLDEIKAKAATKAKAPEKRKPPKEHQRLNVVQPPGRGMVGGFVGEADYSKAKIIVGHSAPESRWSSIPDGEPLFGPMSQRKPLECSEWVRKAYG